MAAWGRLTAEQGRELVRNAMRGRNISPEDGAAWARFCQAVAALGFSEDDFVLLSYGDERASRQMYRRQARRRMEVDKAIGTVVTCAARAGVRISEAVGSRNEQEWRHQEQPRRVQAVPVYVPAGDVDKAAAAVESSTLYRHLCTLFPPEDVRRVMRLYRVGASKEFQEVPGLLASAFPYIDARGRCVDVHLQPYHSSGKRWRAGYCQNWALCKMRQSDRRGRWPVFGEHLVTPGRAVAVVESEKTALLGALAWPHLIFVATGSISNLNTARCAALKDCSLYAFPDADGVQAWAVACERLKQAGYRVVLCSRYVLSRAAGPKDDLGDIITEQRRNRSRKTTDGRKI